MHHQSPDSFTNTALSSDNLQDISKANVSAGTSVSATLEAGPTAEVKSMKIWEPAKDKEVDKELETALMEGGGLFLIVLVHDYYYFATTLNLICSSTTKCLPFSLSFSSSSSL